MACRPCFLQAINPAPVQEPLREELASCMPIGRLVALLLPPEARPVRQNFTTTSLLIASLGALHTCKLGKTLGTWVHLTEICQAGAMM